MKTLIITLAVLLSGLAATAQDTSTPTAPASKPIQTLFNNTSNIGVMVGFTNGYSLVNSKDAYVGGMNFGIILNHSLTIGIAGRGFCSPNSFDNIIPGREAYLGGGYGGLFLEPRMTPSEVVHLTFPCLIGAGGASYLEHKDWNYDEDDWENHKHKDVTLDSDGFFVLEPGVQVEMNVFKWFRIGVGASYRWAYGVDLIKTGNDALDGFSTNMSFSFGKF